MLHNQSVVVCDNWEEVGGVTDGSVGGVDRGDTRGVQSTVIIHRRMFQTRSRLMEGRVETVSGEFNS